MTVDLERWRELRNDSYIVKDFSEELLEMEQKIRNMDGTKIAVVWSVKNGNIEFWCYWYLDELGNRVRFGNSSFCVGWSTNTGELYARAIGRTKNIRAEYIQFFMNYIIHVVGVFKEYGLI